MSHREAIVKVIENYVDAVNRNNTVAIAMTADVRYEGPMLPEPLLGDVAVSEHLEVASSFATMKLQQTRGILFRVEGDAISRIKFFFDTHRLYTSER